MNDVVFVSPAYLDELWSKIACGSLNMHDPTRSFAEIFQWRGKAWVATGGTSKGNNEGAACVDIREVVPMALWGERPFNDLDLRGAGYYTGGRFYPKGKRKETWVMTANEITLKSDPTRAASNAVQLSLDEAISCERLR